jgi:tetratricopeptide (TPR) repeat protein
MVRRFLLAIALLALGFVPLAAYAQTPPDSTVLMKGDPDVIDGFPSDPEGAIRATREMIAAGNMDGAVKRLATYVFAHPKEWAPRRFLGDLYFRTGQIEKARDMYQEILARQPLDKETHNRLGSVLAVLNKVDDAIAQFNAALPGTESVPDLVTLHERRGDLPAYRSQMERAAANFPNDAELQAELGQVYNAVRQPYQASVYFKRALDSDAGNLSALNGLGLSYMSMGDYARATSTLQKCLSLDPRAYQCQDNLGAAYLEMRRFDEAQVALDKAYALEPERAETLVNYGYLADARGDWKTAVAQYAKAIAVWPYLREAYIDLGIDYEDHNLNALAQQALVRGLASVNDDGRLHYLLGKAYEAQGDTKDAVVQFKAAANGTDPTAASIAQTHVAQFYPGDSKPQ